MMKTFMLAVGWRCHWSLVSHAHRYSWWSTQADQFILAGCRFRVGGWRLKHSLLCACSPLQMGLYEVHASGVPPQAQHVGCQSLAEQLVEHYIML